ncbi:ANTAR domain-containing protein [Actinomycetospora flava]|uniref:GAF and ANTAR domain-containing protein n=1 Tax=Actinomycetospora flava TaxID=3129232 RepID=A0ABU8M8U7_9PSEU
MVEDDGDRLESGIRDTARALIDTIDLRADHADVLRALADAAVRVVPHADAGGISRIAEPTVEPARATAAVGVLDRIQADLEEGPCLDAAKTPAGAGAILVGDLANDEARWPEFARRAVALGYRSMLSVQLYVKPGRQRSSLNLYSRRPDAFDDADIRAAGQFALQAAALLRGADEIGGLVRALESRDVIGQAKGILRERSGLTDGQAFQRLVTASQETNMKLVDVAQWLCDESGTTAASPVDHAVAD